MANLFFELPDEIREIIYGIRLSNILSKHYYKRVSQKISLGYFVLALNHKYNISNNHSLIMYFDPNDSSVKYVMEKCNRIITNSDDKIWWISQLIRPVERGLLIESATYYDAIFMDQEIITSNYIKTRIACDSLISKFGCKTYLG